MEENTVSSTPENTIEKVDGDIIPPDNLQVINDIPPINTDENIETVEPEIPSFDCMTVTPYNIAFTESGDRTIPTLFFLCKDRDGKLFLLAKNYTVNSEDELDRIKSIPFAEDKELDHVSKILMNSILRTGLDVYATNMEFSIDTTCWNKMPNPIVSLKVLNNKSKTDAIIHMSAETYSVLAFIDSYILEDIESEHDLSLATIVGSRATEGNVDFFLVDKIDSIISMAPAEVPVPRKGLGKLIDKISPRKNVYDTSVGLVLKLNKFISNDEKEVVSLLIPFDIGVEFDIDKFRGKTIEEIQNEYYGDADQYVCTFMINKSRILGVDKEYLVVRGKNKDKRIRIFLFDASIQEELRHLINNY